MRTIPAALILATTASLALAACADPQTSSTHPDSHSEQDSPSAIVPFDVSSIETVEAIAALVPDAVKERGILRNGASTDYAPSEYLADDGQTPIGYDVDLVQAIARVMGLKEGVTYTAGFDTILPQLGSKFDLGASSFTITPERLEAANMVSYVEVGSAYAVAKGNPKSFDPANPCGTTIGVQNGTYQLDYVSQLSDACLAKGEKKIEIMPLDLQSDIATKVIGGQYDATLADSTVIGYSITLAQGQLEQVGEVIESVPQGIALAKNDEQLAQAVQAALQYLMDEGYFKKILAPYGAEDCALTTAELNPVL